MYHPTHPNQCLTKPSVKNQRHPYQPVQAIYCYQCKKEQIGPIQKYKTGLGTYICCTLLCLFAFIPGLIPFCCNKCKDKVYLCPECESSIRKYPFQPCNCCEC